MADITGSVLLEEVDLDEKKVHVAGEDSEIPTTIAEEVESAKEPEGQSSANKELETKL